MAYQELANKYFQEYQNLGQEQLTADLARWKYADDIIRDLSLSEKAKYADYVTKKICENHTATALSYTLSDVIPMITHNDMTVQNSCAIGNVAAHLMLLPESRREQYNKIISEQKTCILF